MHCVLKLQNFISIKIFGDIYTSDLIKDAIELLDIFYNTNEDKRTTEIDFREFYNDSINKEVNIQDHYDIWLELKETRALGEPSNDKFCLLDFPWILDT